MTRVALLAACASLPVVVLWGQTPASDQIPTFRTGIDVIQLDVTVLGKDHLPVRGLTASDFTIRSLARDSRLAAGDWSGDSRLGSRLVPLGWQSAISDE